MNWWVEVEARGPVYTRLPFLPQDLSPLASFLQSVSSGSACCFLGRPSVPGDTLELISGRVTQILRISFELGSRFHLPSLLVLFKASAALDDGISGVVWVCPACSDRPLTGKATPGLKAPGRPLPRGVKSSL